MTRRPDARSTSAAGYRGMGREATDPRGTEARGDKNSGRGGSGAFALTFFKIDASSLFTPDSQLPTSPERGDGSKERENKIVEF